MVAKEIKLTSLTIIAAALIVFAGISFFQLGRVVGNSEPAGYINYGWDVTYHDRTYTNVALADFIFSDLGRGERIVLTVPMPEFDKLYPILIVHMDNYFFEVQKNGKPVFNSMHPANGRPFVGRGNVSVPIGNFSSGEELKIVLTVAETDAFKRLTPFRLMSAADYYSDIYIRNFYIFICVHFMFITGLLGVVMGIILKVLKREMAGTIFFVGLFGILTSNAIGIESQIMSLFFHSAAQLTQMRFSSISGAIVCLLALLYNQLDKYSVHRKFLLAAIFTVAIGSVVTILLHVSNIVHVRNMLGVIRIFVVIISCYGLFIAAQIIINQPVSKCLPVFGCGVLVVFFMFDEISYLVSYYTIGSFVSMNVMWLATGIMILILCTIAGQVLYINLNEYRLISKTYEEQSVYQDFITGLLTRNKTLEILETLQKNKKDYSIIWIDIDNLPLQNSVENAEKINDMLAVFSDIVKHIPTEDMYVGRFDTGRFLFIGTDLTEKKIRHFLFVLQGMVNAENSHSQLPLSLAGGYAFSKDCAAPNFQSVLRLATQQNILPIEQNKTTRVHKA